MGALMPTYKLVRYRGEDIAAYLTTAEGEMRSFPLKAGNADYERYLSDVDGGATVLPADPEPLVYGGTSRVEARIRTTDATPTELFRRSLLTLSEYEAEFKLRGIDAVNGSVRRIRADVVAKRLNGGALMVGAPIVIANHQDTGAAATTSGVANWAITASVSGVDFVITVTGAAGRTIDWMLSGVVESFTPGGS